VTRVVWLIFSSHLRIIHADLASLGYRVGELTGDMQSSDQTYALDQFRADKVCLLS
jgi:hypothetical protein